MKEREASAMSQLEERTLALAEAERVRGELEQRVQASSAAAEAASTGAAELAAERQRAAAAEEEASRLREAVVRAEAEREEAILQSADVRDQAMKALHSLKDRRDQATANVRSCEQELSVCHTRIAALESEITALSSRLVLMSSPNQKGESAEVGGSTGRVELQTTASTEEVMLLEAENARLRLEAHNATGEKDLAIEQMLHARAEHDKASLELVELQEKVESLNASAVDAEERLHFIAQLKADCQEELSELRVTAVQKEAEVALLSGTIQRMVEEHGDSAVGVLQAQMDAMKSKAVKLLEAKDKELVQLRSKLRVLARAEGQPETIVSATLDDTEQPCVVAAHPAVPTTTAAKAKSTLADQPDKDQLIDQLKREVHRLRRIQKREGVNMEYLKNVVVKYLETEDGLGASEHEVRFRWHC
jgi:chromosome segregation ATPase